MRLSVPSYVIALALTHSAVQSFRPLALERPGSGAGLEHQVQGRLCGAADRAEATLEHHLAQAGLAGLGAEPGAASLRERPRCADERGESVVHAPHGIEVVLDPVAGE